MKYIIGSDYDKITHEKFYYCHMDGFPNVPVFGSIGSYQKAKSICNLMNNKSKGKE